jgi:hypothetical protein
MLAEVDPDVAAIKFARDLDLLWADDRPARLNWTRTAVDELTEIIEMPARMADGTTDAYLLRLHAAHYDLHPPHVNFVEPGTWENAGGSSPWLPLLESLPSWFGLHPEYKYLDGSQKQLLCFTFNADYYLTEHSPQQNQLWQQGRHTVAATLNRIHEILGPAYYRGPAAQRLAEAA